MRRVCVPFFAELSPQHCRVTVTLRHCETAEVSSLSSLCSFDMLGRGKLVVDAECGPRLRTLLRTALIDVRVLNNFRPSTETLVARAAEKLKQRLKRRKSFAFVKKARSKLPSEVDRESQSFACMPLLAGCRAHRVCVVACSQPLRARRRRCCQRRTASHRKWRVAS